MYTLRAGFPLSDQQLLQERKDPVCQKQVRAQEVQGMVHEGLTVPVQQLQAMEEVQEMLNSQ